MDFNEILKMGAGVIQGNSDESTTNLESESIVEALKNLLGNAQGELDLGALVTGLGSGGLGGIVNSWLGNGENSDIDANGISEIFGAEKISQFASELGLSQESATDSLVDAIPSMIDNATQGEGSMVDEMLDKVGGVSGAMDMLGKIFR